MKGNSFKASNWKVNVKESSFHEILVAIKEIIPLFMQDKLEDNQEDYRYLTHEYLCDLLSTI